jgi:Ser/Thr protein kinase RdoA (MazF antagonist)
LPLDAAHVVDVFRQSGLIRDDQIVEEGIALRDHSRRNEILAVFVGDRPAYFVKQAYAGTFDSEATLANERRFYAWVDHCEELTWRGNVPAPVPVTSLPDALVLRAVAGAQTLNDFMWSEDDARLLPDDGGDFGSVGELLGKVHATSLAEDGGVLPLPTEVPWVLGLRSPTPDILPYISLSDLEALMIVQRHQALLRVIGTVYDSWAPEVLVHGDLRTENVLIASDGGREPALLDWEFVGRGPRAWDIGCFLAELAAFWAWRASAERRAVTESGTAEEASARDFVRVAARRFWRGYRRAWLDATAAQANATLLAAYQAVPVRLVQLAIEVGRRSEQLETSSLLLLQLAANLAEEPVERGMALVGLGGLPVRVPGRAP